MATPPQTGMLPLIPLTGGAASPLPPAAPSPGDPALAPSKQMWLVTMLSIANARLLILVAFLSIACIYLSGIVIGRKIEANTEAETSLPPRPVVPPRVSMPVVPPRPPMPPSMARPEPVSTPSTPSVQPVSNTQDIADFVAAIGRLESQKRLLLTQSQSTSGNSFSWKEGGASTNPQAVNVSATVGQMRQQAERLRQLQQELATIPRPTPCSKLYDTYQHYLIILEISYKGLERGFTHQANNLPDAQDMLNTVYRNAPGNIQQAAVGADRELNDLCLRNGLTKSFTIE